MDVFLMRNFELEIINFIDQGYNAKRYYLFGDKKELKRTTNIRDDLNLVYEDCVELMEEYFERWAVDPNGFEILDYFNPEYLGSKERDPHIPLTLEMLIESAKAGRWLYGSKQF